MWQVTLAVALAAAVGGAAATHKYHVGRNAIAENARLETQRLRERAARNAEQLAMGKVIGAINAATKREQEARAAGAAAGVELDGLRHDLSDLRRRLPGMAADACRERAATLTAVFEQCAAEYQGMAEKAQRHSNDTLKLEGAWPKPADGNGPGTAP